MVQNSEFKTQNEELDIIFSALSNRNKRMIIYFIGEKGGRIKGGAKNLNEPLCEKYKELELNPYAISPRLTMLKYQEEFVEQDKEGYWFLTELGKKAYKILKVCFEEDF